VRWRYREVQRFCCACRCWTIQVRLFKSAADAFWEPTKNVLAGLHGRTWLAPLVMLWPLLVLWTPVVAIVVGAWESHPAVLLAGCAAYVAL